MNNAKKHEINRQYAAVLFHKKTGKIAKAVESVCGYANLKLWLLQSMQKNKDGFIFCKDTGEVIWYAEGKDGAPKVYEENLGVADDYCPGLQAAFND